MDLWHACVGSLISLPKKGSIVVYLPQVNLKHLSRLCRPGRQASNPPYFDFQTSLMAAISALPTCARLFEEQLPLLPQSSQHGVAVLVFILLFLILGKILLVCTGVYVVFLNNIIHL
ncbi:hypothetical protein R3W88_008328 [Solanum pinnatisectum]|uniref:Uncharacterized protein n=1 Tax=Solanum pinnatisectum TaxID=50273 RepID=A0AAV9MBE1_9SOLN|nr:hypothetical protein R3W88_008328 [Solanum pinnatisectum]